MKPLPSLLNLYANALSSFLLRGDWPNSIAELNFSAAPLSPDFVSAYHTLLDTDAPLPLLTCLYPYVQRAHLALMIQARLPFAIPGIVHLSNVMTQLHSIDWQNGFTIRTKAQRLPDANNGAQMLKMSAILSQQHDVMHCDSVYLVRRGRGKMDRPLSIPLHNTDTPLPLNLTPTLVRRYARISGDFNPIHLHPWLAKRMGAPNQMAHGMYCAALIARHVQHRPTPLRQLSINFIRPVIVPTHSLSLHLGPNSCTIADPTRVLASATYSFD